VIAAINAGISGARAFERKVDVSASNVANAITREFKKSRVMLEYDSAGGVSARIERVDSGVREVGAAELPNVDLAEEITEMLLGQWGFELNLKTIRTGDEMLGALLDLKG
jgi:flagellar hook protein FlgE